MSFYIANEEEIKKAKTTDIYFQHTKQILEEKGQDKEVVAEITASLPKDWEWGVLSGVEEAATLLSNYNVEVDALSEGTIFKEEAKGVPIPIMNIRGKYKDFCEVETPLLGLLCQSSGISTKAARIKKIAPKKKILSFGVRRMHPAISPMIDRAAMIGGLDGVSSVLSAEKLGLTAQGTMPHSLVIIFQNQEKAWKSFDQIIPKDVPRIALCDTYCDEKEESLRAAKSLDLEAVRLDTPSSRRGDMIKIIREVRWELDSQGFDNVGIFISGGIDEESARKLKGAPLEGLGVGTSISNGPVVDFALNIVEIEKKGVAKRGVFGNEKQLWRCPKCKEEQVLKMGEEGGFCCEKMQPMLHPLIRKGEIKRDFSSVEKIGKEVLKDLKDFPLYGSEVDSKSKNAI